MTPRIKQPTTTCPFTILVDGREKAPYRFTGLTTDAVDGKRPIIVPTEWAHLKTGDYAIQGIEDLVTVERKSMADLFSTLAQHRERFEREHERMAEFRRAVVVIEAMWWEIINFPPERSKLNPKTVFRTALSWHVRYGVPWITLEDRRLAEVYTFRFLQKCWKEFRS
jgi:DNA excision repair protein ERCC-4